MSLSPKQRRAFQHANTDRITFLADGAAGSGKTAACGAAMGMKAAMHEGDHVLLGRTESAVMRNVVRAQPLGMLAAFRYYGVPHKVSSSEGKHISIDGGRSRIWVFGASDSTAVDRIAGSTFQIGLVDELTRLHNGEELWQMLWTRFRLPMRKIWATTNPGAVRHWVKRLIIETPERYRAEYVQYLMKDNPALTEDVKASIVAGMIGHHKSRLVEGLWVDATGLIYPNVTTAKAPKHIIQWSLGLDWAASGIFAAILLGECAITGRMHAVAERYYDHRERGAITDEDQAKRTHGWVREYTPHSVVVYGDPTTPTAFQHELELYGHQWQDGMTDVLYGIRETSAGFASQMLTVDPGCTDLLRELDEYTWDEKAAEAGEDKPRKGADHGVDAVRYAWATESPVIVARPWT